LLAAVAKRTVIPAALRDRILLRCYIALDALNRSRASRELFVMLGQFVLMAEALTALEYLPEAKPQLLLARTSLVKVHERAADSGNWGFLETEYLLLRECVACFAAQLDFASYENVLKAETAMLAYLATPANVT
jgi:hypothetical protein